MRRPASGFRPALPRRTIVGLFATLVSFALLPCAVAVADSYSTDFESFTIGSVNGQDGWISPPPPTSSGVCSTTAPYSIDQSVVDPSTFVSGVTAFGSRSLRFSNLCSNSAFTGTQMYSPTLTQPAGENEANKVFTFQFSFMPTTTTYQPGLYVSVAPDNGTGFRMFRVDLTDIAVSCGDSTSCVLLSVADSPTGADGYIVSHPLALLDPSMPHTIKVTMKFNPGDDNDLVRVSVDGTDTGQCFASWENYYRMWQPGNFQNTSDLEFRATVAGFSGTNAGYLFDNVSYSSSNGAGPEPCDLDIGKTPDSSTVTAGGLAGYTLTAHNRGKLAERNLLLCDHIPKHTTFVSANRKLRQIGSKRCLFIRSLGPGQSASVHVMLRVDANTAPGNLDNVADITPEPPTGVPETPPAVAEDVPPNLPPSGASAPVKPIKKVKAVVKVRAAVSAAPPVTG
jgi:uncharacterized repeat protein (TIGR01451 family)